MTVLDVMAKLPDWCDKFHIVCEFPMDQKFDDRWHYADFYSMKDVLLWLSPIEVIDVSFEVIKCDPFSEMYSRNYDSGIVKDVIQTIIVKYTPGIETICKWHVTTDGHELGLMERGDTY